MPCTELVELENIWKKRYERANYIQAGGWFAVPETRHSNALTIRQSRAKQAQAAHAMIQHQRQCPVCNGNTHTAALAS